ncbi:hypothetical protein HYH03_001608 [Edaphochlamys debaryana]|uniref:Uncharacterized protein n=1 Tax=Edaphochlamys debaryana TaxID=47281 RepID=A0A836C6L8_9CHLO|nr:hypothetical protein HYH03_001608 [Edaphochlamys debaryana]|eukprot:KAG2500847.1 hypothetical protein HYH03_001608 [Edaphochlamys debaryana]
MGRLHSRSGTGTATLLLCMLAAPTASGNWGEPGHVVASRLDRPSPCQPPPSPPINLNAPYDIFDQLLFNGLRYLVVRSGGQALFANVHAFSLVAWNAIAPYDCSAQPHPQLMSASTPAGAFLLAPSGCSAPGTSKYSTPECVGIRAAEVTYAFAQANGWNIDGSRTRSFNRAQYEDYTNYVPKNTPWELTHQCKWQPLHETDGRGKMWIQTPFLPSLGRIKMAIMNTTAEIGRTVPMWDCGNPAAYKAEVDEILAYSATLNDTTKTIAEVFGGMPWWGIAILQLRQHKNWSTIDLFAFNLVQVLMLDAGVVVLKEKYRHDAVRPASAVRWLYGGTNITAYGGPDVGRTVSLPAEDWVPYVTTSPDPEFPSGTACFCRVFTQWLQLWQGGSTTISPPIVFGWPAAGCSIREPDMTPSGPSAFFMTNMAQFRQICHDGRVIGGAHFRVAMDAGDQLCDGLVPNAWPTILKLYPKLAGKST